VLEEMSNN